MARTGRQLEFNILGPLEVLDGGAPLALGGPKQRALLALLLIHADEVVSVDRIIEELWGDHAPKTAQTSLHVYVSHLRKLLEPERGKGEAASLLASRAPGYALAIEPERLDVARFEQLAGQGRLALASGDHGAAAVALHEALGLWRGPALADFLYEPFAQSEIARLEELRLSCTEDRIEADLACGRHGQLVGELEQLTRSHPLRERLRGQLMLALYRAGRQAEALDVYAGTRETLVEELGIDPGPPLQALNHAILNQDPSLAAPIVAAAPAPAAGTTPPAPSEDEPSSPPPEPGPPRETRKVVTILCACLAETGHLAERADPEIVQRVMRRVGDAAKAAIERHGGIAEETRDGFMLGVFGVPHANEDDAMRALRAAADLRDAVSAVGAELEAALGPALGATVAVHTGEVLAADDVVTSGDVRSTAFGLERSAAHGEILLTDATRRLVPDGARVEAIEPVGLRGRTLPLRAWRLVELVDGAPGFGRRLETPLVGRAYELDQLQGALGRAVRERTLVLFTLLGSAGVGKSRLTRELLAAVGDDTAVLVGRCLSYGEGITFLPLREIVDEATGGRGTSGVTELLGGDAEAAELLAGLVGLDETDVSVAEAADAARRLIEALAAERAVVLVIEDIHWAEPALLDLLDELTDLVRDVPVLLLCLARPELLDSRPTWGGGKHNAVALLLEPLSEEAAAGLIDAVSGGTGLDPSVRERVAHAAEGNPLFIEQMVALIAEDGWSGELEVPPTIQAILAARLDRLGPAERAVIERAALVGREFGVDAVQELSADALRPTIEQHLTSLVRKELVRRASPSRPGQAIFRFRHSLIRDAAYRSLSKERRAELHELFADWLERTSPDEPPEIVGYHLEQSYRYRAELSLLDEDADGLALRASDLLSRAGHGALGRGDVVGAVHLLERAVALDRSERVEPLIELAEALQGSGQLERAAAVLAEATEAAERAGDRRALASIMLDRLDVRALVEPDFGLDEMQAGAEEALVIFEDLGDELGLARAWRSVAEVHLTRCHWSASTEALERALGHAERAEGAAELASGRVMLASTLFYGPTPVAEAKERCEELLTVEPTHPVVEANVLCYLGGLAALEGHYDEARKLQGRGRKLFEELDHAVGVAGSTTVSGPIELLAGDPAAAERELRAGYEAFEAMGETGILSTLAALLAEAVLAQGRDEEAVELTRASEHAATEEDAASQIAWRTVRAVALARRGEVDEARVLADDAVARAAETDFLVMHAAALVAQAEVLRAAGEGPDADGRLAEAAGLYDAKGARIVVA